MNTLANLFAIVLVVAGMAFVLAGPKAASKVMGSPFALFGWLLRGMLAAFGRGLVRVIADIHRYCYRRRPGVTVLAYLGIFLALLAVIAVLSGCGEIVQGELGREFRTGGTEVGVEFSVNSGGTSSARGRRVENGKVVDFRDKFGRRR